MKLPAIDDAFFRGKALLLVEDALTRVVLSECWRMDARTRDMTVRPVGGHGTVKALVQAARELGHGYVFGLVDRDFAMPSRAGDAVMRTARHEIENHLLDFDALARLSKGKTGAEIGEIAREKAESLQAWMAVRRTLLEMKQDLPGFPPDPKISDVPDASTARQWLSALAYPKNVEQQANRAWTKTDLLDRRLPHHEQQCASEVTSGKWIEFFSGKEILRHVRSVVPWQLPLDSDEVLAFKVAEHWQRKRTVPAFIHELRDTVLRGSGL